jgi:hypothetical protein
MSGSLMLPERAVQWPESHDCYDPFKALHAAKPYAFEYEHPCEPYVLAFKPALPPFDQRWRGRQLDKISYVTQMAVWGFHFVVSNETFMLHLPHQPGVPMLPLSIAEERTRSDWLALPYGLTRVMLEDLMRSPNFKREVVPKVPGLPDKRTAIVLKYKSASQMRMPRRDPSEIRKERRNSGEEPFEERWRRRLQAEPVPNAPPCQDACCAAMYADGPDQARWVGPHPRLGGALGGAENAVLESAERGLGSQRTPEEKISREHLQATSEARFAAGGLRGMSAGWSGWTLGCVLAAWGTLIVALIAVPRARGPGSGRAVAGGVRVRRARR